MQLSKREKESNLPQSQRKILCEKKKDGERKRVWWKDQSIPVSHRFFARYATVVPGSCHFILRVFFALISPYDSATFSSGLFFLSPASSQLELFSPITSPLYFPSYHCWSRPLRSDEKRLVLEGSFLTEEALSGTVVVGGGGRGLLPPCLAPGPRPYNYCQCSFGGFSRTYDSDLLGGCLDCGK